MKKTSTIVMLLLITFLIVSCSKTITLTNSPAVPGAEGKVKVTKDKNNNYKVVVDVVNLAESKKLSPPRNTYVVWMDTEGNPPRNIGQVSPSSNMFSKSKKAQLKAVTTAKPTKVYVTAEDSGNVQTPVGDTVLSSK
ncbi:hypothetical protein OCK74_21975 [Chitinophagaceae bacterium LB-8]|uniref:Uncharacterized protein n=1 Tax=Paraflavisolibacter caeni TaxID=2982496 RepID=A0A9X2XPU1_9BACT|nr:hypothetical protein [Paraflavisolibacter caeni]MCU7551804.1 hypothetical protein [Paraflavisolibacter caeni]